MAASIIDTLQFNSGSYVWPFNRILKRSASNNTYVIAYPQGNATNGQTGWVATLNIQGSGSITSVVDTLKIEDTSYCDEVDLIEAHSGVFAAAYRSTFTDNGWIKTFLINSAGDIGASTEDSLQFETGYCNYPCIVPVSGNYFAIAYQGPDFDGWLATITIDNLGIISNSVIDSFEFNPTFAAYPDIIHVGGNYFAVAYTDSTGAGQLIVVDIDTSGTIGSIADSWEFATSLSSRSKKIIPISGNVYAITYASGDYIYTRTFTIDSSTGAIGTEVDYFRFSTSIGVAANFGAIKLQGSPVIIIATRMDGPTVLAFRTFTVGDDGTLGDTTLDSFSYSLATLPYQPRLVETPLGEGICLGAFGHNGAAITGTAITFQVTVPTTTTILSNGYIVATETSTIISSALVIAKHTWITDFKAIPHNDGILLSWIAGYGSNSSLLSSKCKVTIQYSTDGFNFTILNTLPYVVRDLIQYQGTPNAIYHPNLIQNTSYYYSLFIFYEDTQLWYGPFYPVPQGVTLLDKVNQAFNSGSISFSKLNTNTRINPLHEVVADVIVWLPNNRSGSAKSIEDTLNLIKPAHVKLNILYEHYYVAHTTSTQFNQCTFSSGSYEVSKGALKNKIATIDSSFDGHPKILGG